MENHNPELPEPPAAVFTVLSHLGVLRLVCGVLAVLWALGAWREAPRWAAWIALVFAIAAFLTNAIVM